MNTKTYSNLIAKQYGGYMFVELLSKLQRLLDLKEREMIKELTGREMKPTKQQEKHEVANQPTINFSLTSYEHCMRIITHSRLTETWQSLDIIPMEVMEQFLAIVDHNDSIITEDGKFFVKKMVRNYIVYDD